MKGKKNLEKAIVMGVMLSNFAAPVWAEDKLEVNKPLNPPGEMYEIKSGQTEQYKEIDVLASDLGKSWNDEDVTALIVRGHLSVEDGGTVEIVSHIENDPVDGNNALYARDGGIVNIDADNVYIAAFGGEGKRDAAISAKHNGDITINGKTVQIIGNIDFIDDNNANTDNIVNITLNSSESFWYGNEGQAANVGQLSKLSGEVADIVYDMQLDLIDKEILSKTQCQEKLDEAVEQILANFGGGNLNLTLSNGAEWVYDSNGNVETEFETGELVKRIPDSMLEEMLKSAGVSDEKEIDKLISGGKLLLSIKLIQEYGATLPVTIQSEVSKISAITLDGGVVNLNDDYIKHKYADYIIADGEEYIKHQKVTIGELKGKGGIFKVDLDWSTNKGTDGLGQKKETENSDYIYIEKMDAKANGNSTQVVDFDASKADLDQMKIGKDRLYFANVADGETDFVTVNGTKQAVSSVAGNIYNYEYSVGSEDNIVTYSTAKENTTENTTTQPVGTEFYIEVTGKSAEGNANYESAKGAMYAGYALGTEFDTLNKRMGEARYLEDDNGVWVRYRHAKTGWDDTFETNSDMFQLGFDKQVQEDDGTHYRGVAVDYTDADTSLMHASGDGENKRYAVSLYDTWIGEKGHYRDLVLRGGRINSDYDISGMFDNGMADIGGDYHQWFGSISAEWGRKNDMQSGWYFEPQTQLQLARVGGASYVSYSGINVDQDGATSLIGRVGFRLGREYEKNNGKTDNYYFKADLMHEFIGDKGIALSTATERYTEEYDGQETWFDIGLGADISIGKNSFFWADVERTLGADFDNTWQVNGGFRWEF